MNAPRVKWQKTISYIRLVLQPWGLLSLAALVALGVIELNSPTARGDFTRYQVTIGLMAGLLNLIFTLSVVNRIIQQRDELRWKDIRNITLKGLNDEVRSTRDILWVALFGHPPFGGSKQTEAACNTADHSGVGWPHDLFGDAEKQIEASAQILAGACAQLRDGHPRPQVWGDQGPDRVLVARGSGRGGRPLRDLGGRGRPVTCSP